MKKIRTAAAVMTAAAAAAALAGCGGKKETGNANELTYWVEFANQPAAGVASYDELPVYQELQKRLGVDIKFIHPVAGQTEEQLNLMLASREFPDIIQYQFYEYPGGAQKAIDDSVIISLNDIMEKSAPNLSRYLAENSDVDREVKTDENNYYCFPNIYGDEYLLTYSGPIVRQDFLDKVGLEQPETIDEWHTTLKAFREKLSLPSPYSAKIDGLLATFTQAFGVGSDIYVDGGKVKYGPYEAGYKDFLTTMAAWYKEGLIDRNLASLDTKTVSQNVLNSYTGLTFGNTSGGIGKWMAAMKDSDGFSVVPVKYPVLKKGDKPMMGHRINKYLPFGSASISTQCKNVELAAKVLDYGYSDEGRMLYNFGIEGQHYNMVDGYPTYSEFMTNDPDGKGLGTMISIYTRPNGAAPTVVDKRYMEQAAALDAQKESIEIWADADTKEHYLPSINFTSAESSEVAKLKSDIASYQEQMMFKFITGVTDMSEYDTYIQTLKKMNVERFVEIYQAAYDRYMKK